MSTDKNMPTSKRYWTAHIHIDKNMYLDYNLTYYIKYIYTGWFIVY